MPTESNKSTARRFYDEVWNAGNLEAIDTLLASDFVDHAAPPGVAPGREGAKQVIGMYRGAFPDLQVTVEDIIAEGDRVVARWSSSGTHQGELMGIPATGRQVRIGGIDIFRFAGDTMAEHWAQFDMLGIMQQIGAAPAPGQGGA